MEFVLPAGGKGFTIRGPNGPLMVGGLELKRSSVLHDGIASFTTETRSVRPEISADEAEAANRALRRLAAEDAVIRAPPKSS